MQSIIERQTPSSEFREKLLQKILEIHSEEFRTTSSTLKKDVQSFTVAKYPA